MEELTDAILAGILRRKVRDTLRTYFRGAFRVASEIGIPREEFLQVAQEVYDAEIKKLSEPA